jgi:phosphoribosylanthranilate isomerase
LKQVDARIVEQQAHGSKPGFHLISRSRNGIARRHVDLHAHHISTRKRFESSVDGLGPDHIGLVVDEGIETWDSVDELTATAIAAVVNNAKLVALSLSTDTDRILETAGLLDAPIIHLARAHEMEPAALASLRESLAPRELMLTVPVRDRDSLAVADRLGACADFLLMDSKDPSTGIVGATGLVHDWNLSAEIVARSSIPVFLAGGLGPDNVTEAIRRVRSAGVDSETRTSRADDRRRKDIAKVEAFIARAQSALA